MLHTALFFIIHNSPNNVAGIVFIIILCKGKVENPGLDLIPCEEKLRELQTNLIVLNVCTQQKGFVPCT